MAKKAKKEKDPAAGAPLGALVGWIKQHPTILLALTAATGISGEQVVSLLQADIPGWTLGGVVLLWAALHWGKKVADNVVALVQEFREFRVETRQRFEGHDGVVAGLIATSDDHGKRISLIENVFKAEIIAYHEKARRETGKIPPKSE